MHVGGAERQLCMLAAAQTDAGIDVHVALVHGGPHLERLIATGATVHRVRASSNHDPRILWRIVGLIRRTDPALVQTWIPQMDVFAGLAAMITRRPWILSERSMASAYVARWKDRTLRVLVGRCADAIVANSPGGLDYWRTRAAETSMRSLVPNMLALDAIRAASPVDPWGEGAAGSRHPEPFVLFVGRLSAEKNLRVVIEALALLPAEQRFRAVLCGDGPLRAEIEALAARRGVLERVLFAGQRSDAWGLMKSASALIGASIFEGQPNVVLEGAASGCPLILSDIPAHRAVMDDRSATFFPADNPERLAEALIATLQNPATAAERADEARCRVSDYSPARAVRGYQAVYDQLLERH